MPSTSPQSGLGSSRRRSVGQRTASCAIAARGVSPLEEAVAKDDVAPRQTAAGPCVGSPSHPPQVPYRTEAASSHAAWRINSLAACAAPGCLDVGVAVRPGRNPSGVMRRQNLRCLGRVDPQWRVQDGRLDRRIEIAANHQGVVRQRFGCPDHTDLVRADPPGLDHRVQVTVVVGREIHLPVRQCHRNAGPVGRDRQPLRPAQASEIGEERLVGAPGVPSRGLERADREPDRRSRARGHRSRTGERWQSGDGGKSSRGFLGWVRASI